MLGVTGQTWVLSLKAATSHPRVLSRRVIASDLHF